MSVSSAQSIARLVLNGLINIFPPLLLIFWFLGVNTKETARAALIVSFVLILFSRFLPRSAVINPRILSLLRVFPILFVSLLCFYQLLRVYVGEHGIDFAIFTQVIRSIRDTGVATTTLVGTTTVNFLSHHFTPFLYPLGFLSRFMLEPHQIGIIFQFLSVGIGILFFYKFCLKLGFSRATAGIFSTLLCVNPCFRSGISWGIHDEVFAVGVIGAGLYFWIARKTISCASSLLLLGLFKETFFIAGAIASLFACIEALRTRDSGRSIPITYGIVSALMLSAAIFYFVYIPLHPELFKMSFDPAARIASITSFTSPAFLWKKISFIFYLLLPLFGLPLLSIRGLLLVICASPFWGASLVSNFPEMHKGFNYYAVVPVYVGFFAAAITIRCKWGTEFVLRPISLFLAMCLAFSSGYSASPLRPLRSLILGPTIIPDSLKMIPRNLTVAASEFDTIFVLDKERIVRLWIAERLPVDWDVILVRDKSREPPSERILSNTRLCYQDERWKVYCKKGIELTSTSSS